MINLLKTLVLKPINPIKLFWDLKAFWASLIFNFDIWKLNILDKEGLQGIRSDYHATKQKLVHNWHFFEDQRLG